MRPIDQVSRLELIAELAALAAVWPLTISTERPVRSLVGSLTIGGASGAWLEAWWRALRKRGFAKGRNLAVEFRWADRVSRLPAGTAHADGFLDSAQAGSAVLESRTAR